MWWYALGLLFVGGTMLANAHDGNRGFGSTLLRSAMMPNDLIAAVKSPQGFRVEGGIVSIGDELMRYRTVGTDCGARHANKPCIAIIERGLGGTEKAAHPAGSRVYGDDAEITNQMINLRQIQTTSGWGVLSLPLQGAEFFLGIMKVLSWDYEFLKGDAEYIRMFVLWPFSLSMIGVAIRLITDVLSVIGGLRRSILG